jgi:dTDP-4-amino-4,6-dideoxygalactose transaminase
VAAITDLPHVAWLSNGRSAIAQAAMLSGVDRESTVLLPAYHCESMAAPFAWLGARIRYYRIRNDLSIDLEHLVSIADERTRLVLLPQYFGHLRPTRQLYETCRQRGWTLVEDCAHAFFALGSPDLLGRDSDYVVASTSKFFAAFDGGVLAARRAHANWPRPSQPPLSAELRTILNAVEYAFEYGRLPGLRRLMNPVLSQIRGLRRSAPITVTSNALASRYGGVEFAAETVELGATRVSRWLATRANRAAIASARRTNWQTMRDRLAVSDSVRFPVATLGERDVPYVLALELPDPERVFPELKRRGIPVYRWETAFSDSPPGTCEVSEAFRRSLIQLPCHQSLMPAELAWISDTILSIL